MPESESESCLTLVGIWTIMPGELKYPPQRITKQIPCRGLHTSLNHSCVSPKMGCLEYRAKRTARYLHVSDVIFIVKYTSALKIRAHGRRSALKTKPRDSVWSFRNSVYFYVYKVAMQTNSRSLVATIITRLNTDRKRRLFNFGKGTQVPKEGF